ncbi:MULTISPECIES: hypothetical protein [Enterococcus]|uniref:hypothetical protein n=1 Tax=Enterococcus sp. AZ103 TaxID=2774628 RepID=UPI003F215E6F
MIELILGILLLVWPIAKIPYLLSNKRKYGVFFPSDKRIFIPKYTNFGNGLNTNNKVGFTINIILSISLLIDGILRIL